MVADINGLLHNPVRLEQFGRVCSLYNVPLLPTLPLHYLSSYLSGLFDSDGTLSYSLPSQQVFLTVAHKDRAVLDMISSVYGGQVTAANAHNPPFQWLVSLPRDLLHLIDHYFHWNNCVSARNKKFGMVRAFYRLSS